MIVTDAGRGAVDAAAFCARRDCRVGWRKARERSTASGREMLLRTAKSCGPDAPTLASSSRSCVGPTGLRQNISADDGGKRARSPGRARRKPLKPLRAGMPGVAVYSLLLVCVLPLQSAHETAGALGIRRSPRPLWAENSSTPRAQCVAGFKVASAVLTNESYYVVPANAGTHKPCHLC